MDYGQTVQHSKFQTNLGYRARPYLSRNRHGGWKTALGLSALAVLSEDLCSFPGSIDPSWTPQTFNTCVTQTHMQAKYLCTQNNINKSLKQDSKI